jgi:LacI family transcriptional regulator
MLGRRQTIKDVAKAAGLGIGTVSRALNGHGNVSPEAREKVSRAAEALGYQPDILARSLRTRRTRTVGYIVRDITNPLFSTVAYAAEAALEKQGYSLLVGNTFDRPEREREIVRMFLSRNVDALILSPNEDEGTDIIAKAADLGLPVVALDRESPEPADRVMTEHVQGVKGAVSYLLELGHRRIAVITGSAAVFAGRARLDGFRRAFIERGLEVPEDLCFLGSFSREYGQLIAERILRRPDRPTAIVCGGTPLLLGMLPVVHELELSVPDDLSIVCCDDIDLTRLYRPPITVVRRDMSAIGRSVAELLLERLEGGRIGSGVTRRFPTEVVLRGSCAAPSLVGK